MSKERREPDVNFPVPSAIRIKTCRTMLTEIPATGTDAEILPSSSKDQ